MFFSESVDNEILTNNIQLGDQIWFCVWLGNYGARTSTGTACQIHMHDTQITVLIRVQMECWDLLKNNIQLGDQHQIWGWPDTCWAKTSTDTVKIIFTYKKQELKWISKYCVYCNLDKTNASEELSVRGWLGPLGARPFTGTINTIIICMKYENTLIIWAYVETKTPINKIQLGVQHLVWGRPGTLQGRDIHWHRQG